MMKLLKCVIAVVAAIGVSSISANASVLLTFEGLKDLESIDGFYNGGTGSLGSMGPNVGVVFSDTAQALIDGDDGVSSGDFGGEPSPSTIMFFLGGSPKMNVAAGFGTSFSTYYTAPTSSGLVEIYDGLNGSGIKLATLDLPTVLLPPTSDPGFFNPFVWATVGFSGTARSVVFTGVADLIGFDNVTLGDLNSNNIVPEPTSFTLATLGVLSVVAGANRLRRQQKAAV